MVWTDNIKPSFLETRTFESEDDFKKNKNSYLLASITDNSMYDTYQKDDTIRIKVTDEIPEECDCLILKEDEVIFRHLREDGDFYILTQTFPDKREEKVNREDIKALGFATSILRV